MKQWSLGQVIFRMVTMTFLRLFFLTIIAEEKNIKENKTIYMSSRDSKRSGAERTKHLATCFPFVLTSDVKTMHTYIYVKENYISDTSVYNLYDFF